MANGLSDLSAPHLAYTKRPHGISHANCSIIEGYIRQNVRRGKTVHCFPKRPGTFDRWADPQFCSILSSPFTGVAEGG